MKQAKSALNKPVSLHRHVSRSLLGLVAAFAVVAATAGVLVWQNTSSALLITKAPSKGDIINGAEGHVGEPVTNFCDTKYSEKQFPCADFVSDVLQALGVPIPENSTTEVNAGNLLKWLLDNGWRRFPPSGSYDITKPPTEPGLAGCVVFFLRDDGSVGHTGIIVSNPPMTIVDASGIQGKVVRRKVNDGPLTERYSRIVIVCPPLK